MAKKKISAFTETTTLADADILPVVINPATVPASRKITTAALRMSLLGNAPAVTTLAESGTVSLGEGTQITLANLRKVLNPPLPDNEEIAYTYDAEGNVTSITITALTGTAEVPVVLDFEWTEVDGGSAAIPLYVVGCSYVEIKNLLLHDASSHCVLVRDTLDNVTRSDHVILRNVLAWNAGSGNNKIFEIYNSDYITLVDCAGWGQARKTFEIYKSNDCAITRCFGRWDASVAGGSAVFAPSYDSFRCAVTDCIGITNPGAAITGYIVAVYSPDHMDGANIGTPAEATCARCLAISEQAITGFSGVDINDHKTVLITYTDSMRFTRGFESACNKTLVLALRDEWSKSPIRDRIAALSGTEVLSELAAIIVWQVSQINYQPATATITDGDTVITVADLQAKILTMTSSTAGRAPTVPAGNLVYAALPINEYLDWSFRNIGNQNVTITAAAGHTLSGNMVIPAGSQGMFRTKCTSVNNACTYRIS